MNEFDLIRQYFTRPCAAPTVLGVGDDCAIVAPTAGQSLLISTDTLVAGRHFPLHTDAYSIGWKAAAVNVSDLAAMAATPYALLLALSLPAADPAFLSAFARGFWAVCDAYGLQLIGGDTTRSPVLSMTVTALGFAPHGQALRRAGAQVGDVLAVTGTLGDAAYALQHPNSPLQARLDRPTPRVRFAEGLRGLASALLDISDGLVQDVGHLARASGVDVHLELDALPRSPLLAALPLADVAELMLAGGDDYELCLSVPAQHWPQVQAWAAQCALPITAIGRVHATAQAQPQVLVWHGGQQYQPSRTGFMHFD